MTGPTSGSPQEEGHDRYTRPLRAEIDAELEQVATSADPVGADEPEREPFETRLHDLHDAAVQQLVS